MFTGKTIKMTNEERQARAEELQRVKEEYEKRNLGSFERIFPSKNKQKQEKYLTLLEMAAESYKETTSGTKNKKSPAKFRVSKRVTTNQSYGEAEEGREFVEERNSKKINVRSQSVKQPQIENVQGSPVMALLSKKTALRTSNEEATMFSRKLESSRHMERIPINIHV